MGIKQAKKELEIIENIGDLIKAIICFVLMFVLVTIRIIFPYKGYTRRHAFKETWLGIKENWH